jgi:undecaprenyl-diphosphatase
MALYGKSAIKRIIVLFFIALGIPVFLLITHLAFYYFTDNVHSVIPGKIYRSAQLNNKGLTHYTKKFHLETIINLRGRWPNDRWYQIESHFAKTHHLNYYSIKFSAYHLPPKERLRELVRLLQTVPKPLIFHCEGGADRTGMAAAISTILYDKNLSMDTIKKQASWHYNAIARTTVGYQMLRNYFAWLKKHHYQSSKQRFLEWVNSSVPMKPYSGWFVV